MKKKSPRRLLAIVNPHSGDGKGLASLDQLQSAADSRGATLSSLLTRYPGHAREWLAEQALEEIDTLVVIGGDGTIHEVVNGLLKRENTPRVPLGILPAGTGDSLMTDLGPPGLETAIDRVFTGAARSIDLFRVETERDVLYGFNMIGAGLPSRVNALAEASRVFKKFRYHAGIVKALWSHTPEDCVCRLPDTGETFTSDFIIATNTRHIGNGLHLAPHAELDDGQLDLFVLTPLSRPALLTLFLKLNRGTHLDDPSVITRRVSTLHLRVPPGSDINLDGEQHRFQKATITVLPKHLSIIA